MTSAEGGLILTHAMPLIGHRYRYLHTLSSSELSQIVGAVDTYRPSAPTADGRSHAIVALKILNAKHWALGAQEYERMRQLWRGFRRQGTCPRILEPTCHFEEGAHFCIVFNLHSPLSALEAPPVDACGPSAPLPNCNGTQTVLSQASVSRSSIAMPRPIKLCPPATVAAASPFAAMSAVSSGMGNGAGSSQPSGGQSARSGRAALPFLH